MEEDDMSAASTAGSVILEPFPHQVGGHSEIKQFGKHTVFKPLNLKEHEFYQEMPSVLKPFIPQFKGVATVSCSDDCEGNPKLIVHPNKETFPKIHKEDSNSEDDNALASSWEWKEVDGFQLRDTEFITKPEPRQYLMLENIISRYKRPCILDLKMGTQCHSDYKISKQEIMERKRKWEKTTARTLGVRIVGMKMYRADYGDVLSKSKKDGDVLTEEGFEETLGLFFSNAKTIRSAVIECFIKKLERFMETMEKHLSSYRFYNSSLLFVYEGEIMDWEKASNCKGELNPIQYVDKPGSPTKLSTCPCLEQLDFRMIDFAHVSRHTSQLSHGPDQEYIFGLKSLIRLLKKILAKRPTL